MDSLRAIWITKSGNIFEGRFFLSCNTFFVWTCVKLNSLLFDSAPTEVGVFAWKCFFHLVIIKIHSLLVFSVLYLFRLHFLSVSFSFFILLFNEKKQLPLSSRQWRKWIKIKSTVDKMYVVILLFLAINFTTYTI